MVTLELVTLDGPKIDEQVYEILLPTSEGAIAIYAQHMPLVTTVVPGVISVRRNKGDADDKIEVFATNGGVAEVGAKAVRILVDEATHAEDLVEQEEREALERAHKLKAEAKDEVELEHAQNLIDRQAVRLKVAELRRGRKARH